MDRARIHEGIRRMRFTDVLGRWEWDGELAVYWGPHRLATTPPASWFSLD